MSTIQRTANEVAALVASFRDQLASTASGYGASLIGVLDSAGYFTGTTVEAVLAELGALRPDNTITDPGNGGAIPVTKSGSVAITTTGAQTRTLAIPTFVGQMLTIYFKTDGGDCVITSSQAINAAGNTSITLNDAGDSLQLVAAYNGTALRWRVAQNDGTVLA